MFKLRFSAPYPQFFAACSIYTPFRFIHIAENFVTRKIDNDKNHIFNFKKGESFNNLFDRSLSGNLLRK